MLIRSFLTFLAVLVFPVSVPPAFAESHPTPGQQVYDTFSVYWDNDILLGTDGDYTNGARFTWGSVFSGPDEAGLPGWSRPWFSLMPGNEVSQGRSVAISFGQSIYTPENIKSPEPDHSDRPYAGYAYLAASLANFSRDVKTAFELQVGVVGPLSFAEETQNFFHNMSGIDRAQGWDNQLENEPTLEIIGNRQWLLWHSAENRGFRSDFISHLGGQLGNVAILANLGGELRWGWHLPDRFAPGEIGEDGNEGPAYLPGILTLRNCYLFTGFDARLVFHDIFLDGNTFTDSQSVSSEPVVADFVAGISGQIGAIRLTGAYVHRTREFELQNRRQQYMVFSLTWSMLSRDRSRMFKNRQGTI